MAVWTSDRLTALRQRAAALREMLPEADPTDLAAEREWRTILDAEQEQARQIGTAHATGLYQGQKAGYNPDGAAEFDPYTEIDSDPDL